MEACHPGATATACHSTQEADMLAQEALTLLIIIGRSTVQIVQAIRGKDHSLADVLDTEPDELRSEKLLFAFQSPELVEEHPCSSFVQVIQMVAEEQQDPIVAKHAWPRKASISQSGVPPVFDPFRGCKIDRFAAVETVAEPPVESLGEGDDELSGVLPQPVDRHPRRDQQGRGDLRRHVMEKVRLLVEALLQEPPHRVLELVRILPRHAVPLLWLSEMVIIHRVHVVVFVVPTEAAEEHAEVEPGHIDAVDVGADMAQHTSGVPGEVVDVPRAFLVVLDALEVDVRVHFLRVDMLRGPRKAAPVLLRVQVIPIFHLDSLRARLHDSPVVLLEGLIVQRSPGRVLLVDPTLPEASGELLILRRIARAPIEAAALLETVDVLDAGPKWLRRATVHAARRIPAGRWHDFAYAIFFRFLADALDVLDGPSLELLQRGTKDRRGRDAVQLRLALALHKRVLQRLLQHARLLPI
mmetsp:Transcript_8531/g.32117  ORF Transcript_8531/g.32117 Transcript_8531/m.32117 type:complete len:469 (+) Transcript_8531:839-2245(+)